MCLGQFSHGSLPRTHCLLAPFQSILHIFYVSQTVHFLNLLLPKSQVSNLTGGKFFEFIAHQCLYAAIFSVYCYFKSVVKAKLQ